MANAVEFILILVAPLRPNGDRSSTDYTLFVGITKSVGLPLRLKYGGLDVSEAGGLRRWRTRTAS